MQAVQYQRYGSAEVLELVEVPEPEARDGEALVRVVASSVNAFDWHSMRGEPMIARLQMGPRRPRQSRIGADVAGIVEAVGPGVTTLKLGDEVLGMGAGAWAELVAVKTEGLVPKPPRASWEEAGVIGLAALTALQGLRDKGGVGPGHRVLVAGAGGGVGHFAVQIAVALGATVIATTSAGNLEMVHSLGADEVLLYGAANLAAAPGPFDVVFDAGGWLSLRQLRGMLRPAGVAVLAGAGPHASLPRLASRLAAAQAMSRLGSRRYVSYLARRSHADLLFLVGLLADGRLRPMIDRHYRLDEIRAAVAYQETGRARGKVAVSIATEHR